MNRSGTWQGISNASPPGSRCFVYELLCKTGFFFSLDAYFSITQFTLWGNLSFQKPQAPHFFSFEALHTGKNTTLLSGWTTDYRSKRKAMMTTVYAHLRRGAFLRVKSVTLSNHLPAAPDRCRELGFAGSTAGAPDRISRPLIPHSVPCRLGRRPPFVSNLLLTSTSYCHVVSWGSLHVEQSPPSQIGPY